MDWTGNLIRWRCFSGLMFFEMDFDMIIFWMGDMKFFDDLIGFGYIWHEDKIVCDFDAL